MPKYTRVALEGATIDGRKITRKQIQEMADQYDPDKRHGARIWLEHFRSLFADGAFPALGDVLNVKTEEVDVDGEEKLGLYAELKPTDQLLEINQKKQKVYTSIEMDVDYADTGKAYLTGLAVTDSPSSQGTQMLAFSQQNQFKELEGKLFSEYLETDLHLKGEEETTEEQTESLFSRIKGIFSKHQGDSDDRFADHEQSMELIAEELEKQRDEFNSMKDELKAKTDELESVKTEFASLKEQIENTSFNKQRPPATGGNNNNKTDC